MALNEGGSLATGKCLEDFDADGSPIVIGKRKLTAKRTKISRKYETPYGVSTVNRYAYQGSEGGAVFYPMEANSRIVGGSTPSFVQSVSYLYSNNNSSATCSAPRSAVEILALSTVELSLYTVGIVTLCRVIFC